FGRNRLRIEEAASVIELHLPCRRQRDKRLADLHRDRSALDGRVERVLPQIAHHAAERTLAVGEEDDGGWNQRATRTRLFFGESRVGAIGVNEVFWSPVLENEAIVRGDSHDHAGPTNQARPTLSKKIHFPSAIRRLRLPSDAPARCG